MLLASAAGCTVEFDRGLLERAKAGCTDGVNQLPGNTPQACGSNGGPCAQCAAPYSVCEAGACVVPNAVAALALGEAHSSAIDRSGGLWLWGSNSSGSLALPADVPEQHTPRRLLEPALAWSSSAPGGRIPELFTCALAAGALYCWGQNGDGQTGLGTAQPGPVPTRVGSDADWTAIRGGGAFTCGIRAGALYCWGYGGDAKRLGLDPLPADTTTPQRLPGAADWADLTLSRGHGCALKRDHTLWCWGENQFGQLGQSAGNAPPAQVKNGTSYKRVSAGDGHTCGIRDNGTLFCWGDNSSGQLGIAQSASEPAQVGTSSDWVEVAAGGRHTCGLHADGTLVCWGSGEDGQLGTGEFADSVVPVPVAGSDWTKLAVGANHSCAVKRDGTLWCWGSNAVGQLGNAESGFQPVAAPVPVLLE